MMKDKHAGSTGRLTAVLGRVAIAFGLGLLFTLVCFGLLQWSESFLPQETVRLLTRMIWWPVAVTCGLAPRDLVCALPGIVFGFLFHWLVAVGFLWWLNIPRPRGEVPTPRLR
jgi:hypothetical protein